MTLDEKYNRLLSEIKKLGKVIVAYSGGVDSNFLLKSCVEAIGAENILACVAANESMPKSQHNNALEIAKQLGVEIKTIHPEEMNDEKFIANPANRCFICKSHLFELIQSVAKKNGYEHVLCGSNTDDYDDYRPGHRAVKNFSVICPLSDAGLRKNEIRQLSRKMGLSTADMPASPCLVSRLSYGEKITTEKLKQIENAEEFLKVLGFEIVRLRHHGDLARIEVEKDKIEMLCKAPTRTKVFEKIKSLGFKYVTIDMQGFRTGAMNEILSEEEKNRHL